MLLFSTTGLHHLSIYLSRTSSCTTSHTYKLIGWSDPAAPTVVAPPPPQEEEEQPKRRKTHAGNERRSSVEDAKARAALAKKDTKTSEESKVQSQQTNKQTKAANIIDRLFFSSNFSLPFGSCVFV
jgi:hypothetical protein